MWLVFLDRMFSPLTFELQLTLICDMGRHELSAVVTIMQHSSQVALIVQSKEA